MEIKDLYEPPTTIRNSEQNNIEMNLKIIGSNELRMIQLK